MFLKHFQAERSSCAVKLHRFKRFIFFKPKTASDKLRKRKKKAFSIRRITVIEPGICLDLLKEQFADLTFCYGIHFIYRFFFIPAVSTIDFMVFRLGLITPLLLLVDYSRPIRFYTPSFVC